MVRVESIPTLEVCLSPALFPAILTEKPYVIVVTDILRATTAMCAAFENGVKEIIPVASLEEAREYKEKGFLVAAEREGSILDFADFGNSPFDYMREEVRGKTIVYSTTNGTMAITLSQDADSIVLGAFVNISAVFHWAIDQGKRGMNLLILCSGWKLQFSLEDSLFAGCLSEKLINSGVFKTDCDAAKACIDLWNTAGTDLAGYMEKAAHRKRLRNLGADDSLSYCLSMDLTHVVPGLRNGVLVAL
ncbi:MAG: 2-phosphosulfolactate phosphatase [Bacteroidetes bacterium]|nr:2-phosphosulfolactate phosphatase [Bacteroidota bacterium]